MSRNHWRRSEALNQLSQDARDLRAAQAACQHTKSHHITDDIRQCDACGQQFRQRLGDWEAGTLGTPGADAHKAQQALTCPESHAVERREAILQSLADLQREDALDEAREVMRDLESERD